MHITIMPNKNNTGTNPKICINGGAVNYVYQIDNTSPGVGAFVANRIFELAWSGNRWFITSFDMSVYINDKLTSKITSGTTDLTPGISSLATGSIHCVYVSTTTPKIWKVYVGVNGKAFLMLENDPKPVALGFKSTDLGMTNIYKHYEKQLEGQGGSGEYKFELNSTGLRPKGLSVSSSGLVTFVDDDGEQFVPPGATGGFNGIAIKITDKVLNKSYLGQFNIHVLQPYVDFAVDNTAVKYDGTPKRPVVTATIRSDKDLGDFELVQDVHYQALINSGQLETTNRGTYNVTIKWLVSGYSTGNVQGSLHITN